MRCLPRRLRTHASRGVSSAPFGADRRPNPVSLQVKPPGAQPVGTEAAFRSIEFGLAIQKPLLERRRWSSAEEQR